MDEICQVVFKLGRTEKGGYSFTMIFEDDPPDGPIRSFRTENQGFVSGHADVRVGPNGLPSYIRIYDSPLIDSIVMISTNPKTGQFELEKNPVLLNDVAKTLHALACKLMNIEDDGGERPRINLTFDPTLN